MRVLCRVDAGPATGLGHLQRCLAVADALQARGVATGFIGPEAPAACERIRARGHDWWPLEASVVDAARTHACDAVIVDSYSIDDADLQALRAADLFVVAIDDLARHAFAAHIVVNGAAGAEALPYASSTGDTRFLLGPAYALLAGAFAGAARRSVGAGVGHVLVSIGGMDTDRNLPRVLRLVDAVDRAFTMTTIVGPFVDDDSVRHARYGHAHDFAVAPQQVAALMRRADLAVSAAGQTLYELAALGTPTVAIELFDNQAANIRALSAAGVVRSAGSIRDGGFDEALPATVAAVIDDAPARAAMSAAGQQLVDGQGAGRVADEMLRR